MVPRTGFEREKECDLVLTAGNFYQTDDQISCGGHTQRFAYYGSLNGNRSQYGLQTPVPQVVNDAVNGFGGFASFIFNPDPKNQYRLVTSLRRDYYQIPIDPDPNSLGNQVYPSSGLHDAEIEPDGYATFSWVHTFDSNKLLTVSPFYHYNGADYKGGANDYPVISSVNQDANYVGMQTALSYNFWKNDLQAGVYGFFQHQHNYFDNVYTDGTPNVPASSIGVNGGVVSEFINDKFKITPWFTLITGLRLTQFNASISENATDPRVGAALKIPRLNWIFNGFYGYYYQAPPLATACSTTAPATTAQWDPFPHALYSILPTAKALPFLLCMVSGTSNGSTESRFRSAAGHSARITMKPGRRTGWITITLENRIFFGRSPGLMPRFKGGHSPCALQTSSIVASFTWRMQTRSRRRPRPSPEA